MKYHHTDIFNYFYLIGLRLNDFPDVINIPDDFEPDIFKACEDGKLTSIVWLFNNTQIDKNMRNLEGNTLLHIAVLYSHLSIVMYLIDKHNFNPNAKGENNSTPLHYACIAGYFPIVEYLIQHGAKINVKDFSNDFPIHIAAMNGNLSIVKYFIEKEKVDINIRGYLYRTPLQYACFKNCLDVIDYLIRKKADIEAKDDENNTALHYAAYWSKLNVVKLLVSNGASIKSKNKLKLKPYQLCDRECELCAPSEIESTRLKYKILKPRKKEKKRK